MRMHVNVATGTLCVAFEVYSALRSRKTWFDKLTFNELDALLSHHTAC